MNDTIIMIKEEILKQLSEAMESTNQSSEKKTETDPFDPMGEYEAGESAGLNYAIDIVKDVFKEFFF